MREKGTHREVNTHSRVAELREKEGGRETETKTERDKEKERGGEGMEGGRADLVLETRKEEQRRRDRGGVLYWPVGPGLGG